MGSNRGRWIDLVVGASGISLLNAFVFLVNQRGLPGGGNP